MKISRRVRIGLGWSLLMLPIIALATFVLIEGGLRAFVIVFGVVASIFAAVTAGVWLIEGDGNA